jgi:hypothetical protein
MTENELLQELINEFELPEREPDEITATMLAENTRKGRRAALDFLTRKYEKGELSRRWVMAKSGKKEFAYRKIDH